MMNKKLKEKISTIDLTGLNFKCVNLAYTNLKVYTKSNLSLINRNVDYSMYHKTILSKILKFKKEITKGLGNIASGFSDKCNWVKHNLITKTKGDEV